MSKLTKLQQNLKASSGKLTLTIGEFSELTIIGQGGNGIVYKAKAFDKEVALKFLVADYTGTSYKTKLTRFLSEYFNIVTIDNNDGLVKYIDYDEYRFNAEGDELSLPVIIMKLYEGSLEKFRDNNLSATGFIELFEFLMRTVKRIHSLGIVHRDIKPENILTSEEKFVLADFGIAGFNPEIFSLRADTRSSERVCNRLFSAPEQEFNGTSAHQTMDIYAIGQVLQWYVTGKTHRGTGRAKISDHFPELVVYDRVIDRCLENEPKNRFQDIKEIEVFIEEYQKKDPFDYLQLFSEVLAKSFPKNEFGIAYTNKPSKIDQFFFNLKEVNSKFDRQLIWTNGSSRMFFDLFQKGPALWKLSNHEYQFTEMWVSYDNSQHNDFALLHYEAGQPFNIDGQEIYYTAIVDGEHHISYAEVSNGYADIGEKTIKLSGHQVEQIERPKEEGYIFISTTHHNLSTRPNDVILRDLIESFLEAPEQNKTVAIDEFASKIRQNKHQHIEQYI